VIAFEWPVWTINSLLNCFDRLSSSFDDLFSLALRHH
jgi:hypothetical protein